MSVMPYKSGAYVAQGSELFFLDDTNGDGLADKRTPLLTGFGFTDTHTMTHTLIKGPNHWIHFSHGALNKGKVRSLTSDESVRIDFSKIGRFSEDGKHIELLNAGLNNIWGLQLRNNGLWFGIEANDLGYSVVPMQAGMAYPGIGNDRLRSYQPFVPKLHSFRVGGTGLSGLAFSDDTEGSFPEEYNDVAFLANPITSTINAVRIVRHADGSIEAEHLEDLLRSEDDWFRPVNIEFGPDGCLYIADWYNKIVSHNEVATTDPDRDKSHGRIWRIRHVSQKPRPIPNFYEINTEDLPVYLRSSSLWARRAAWSQIAERPSKETEDIIPVLIKMTKDTGEDIYTRIHALWSLESLAHYDEVAIQSLLENPSEHLQREAIRSLTAYGLQLSELTRIIKPFLNSDNPEIRAQVLRTLDAAGEADQEVIAMLVSACKPELSGNEMGGSYERLQERFLARRALEKYPQELSEFLQSSAGSSMPPTHRLWALLALPGKDARVAAFVKVWESAPAKELDPSTFIGVANMLDHPFVFKAMEDMIHSSGHGEQYIDMTLKNQSQIQSSNLGRLFKTPVMEMLASNQDDQVRLALEAVNKLDIEGGNALLLSLFKQSNNASITDGILKALANKPEANKEVFISVAKDSEVSFGSRSAALNILSKTDATAGAKIFNFWWPEMSPDQKKDMIEIYSSSKAGNQILLDGLEAGIVNTDLIELSTAERINHLSANKKSEALLDRFRKKEEQKMANTGSDKVEKFVLMTEQNKGVASQGKVLFTTCMLCHQVGDQGQDIAPALDGSAYRDTGALLTAILEPDEAVESGYYIYRVTKKDDSVVEGLMYEKNDKGTTIAFMGGTKVFIPKEVIAKEGFLAGRSFMPAGLIDHYSPQQVADLVEYIKTLK